MALLFLLFFLLFKLYDRYNNRHREEVWTHLQQASTEAVFTALTNVRVVFGGEGHGHCQEEKPATSWHG
jgi:hypothetical protein